jgi:hypothetical protein
MSTVKHKTRPIRVCVVSIALSIAFGSVIASLERLSAQNQKASGTTDSSKRILKKVKYRGWINIDHHYAPVSPRAHARAYLVILVVRTAMVYRTHESKVPGK